MPIRACVGYRHGLVPKSHANDMETEPTRREERKHVDGGGIFFCAVLSDDNLAGQTPYDWVSSTDRQPNSYPVPSLEPLDNE